MEKGKVMNATTSTAVVLFENTGIQKTVKVAKHIGTLKAGDEVVVVFESEMIGGVVIGVV